MAPEAERDELVALARAAAPDCRKVDVEFARFGALPVLIDQIEELRRIWPLLADEPGRTRWWPIVTNLDALHAGLMSEPPTWEPPPGAPMAVPWESPAHVEEVAQRFDLIAWLDQQESAGPMDPGFVEGEANWSELLTDGCRPDPALLERLARSAPSYVAFQRSLWEWEIAEAPASFPLPRGQAEYVEGAMRTLRWADEGALVLLPLANGVQASGYLTFCGVEHGPRDHLVAAVHGWERRYGARLWFSDTVQLGFLLPAPLDDRESAWSLAREAFLVEPAGFYTSGYNVRVAARDLLVSDEFHLFDRP